LFFIQMPMGKQSLKEENKEVEIHSEDLQNKVGFSSPRKIL